MAGFFYEVGVTGWRHWDDRKLIHTVLNATYWQCIKEGKHMRLNHGDCPREYGGGADQIANDWAVLLGVAVRKWPADYDGKGRILGKERNARMCREGGLDLGFAFDHPQARGTKNCMKEFRKNNIPYVPFQYGFGGKLQQWEEILKDQKRTKPGGFPPA